MADDDHDRVRSKRWIALVALPVLYVLSIGPNVWTLVFLGDRLSPTWVDRLEAFSKFAFPIFYAPLIWSAERMLWLDKLLDWYVNLVG